MNATPRHTCGFNHRPCVCSRCEAEFTERKLFDLTEDEIKLLEASLEGQY
jgi:hypothetical protein